jgi:DNA-directed RNA polymerase specialized sigma24 family protein
MGVSDQPDAWSSAELLDRATTGNQAAEAEIFERYAQRLIALARSRLAAKLVARLDAEDIVQSAYRSFFVAAREGGLSCIAVAICGDF